MWYEFEEFNTHKSKIKKIVIFVLLFIVALAIIIGSAFFAKTLLGKDEIGSNNEKEKQMANVKSENITNGKKRYLYKHDTERIKDFFLPKITEQSNEDVKNIYFSEEKQVYLTFDDGPSQTVTPQVLEILDKYNVKATFFVLGSRVDLNPEIVKQTYEKGHYIANHGYTHIYSSIYASPESVLDEYNRCSQAVKDAIGNQKYETSLFRFPGGSSGGKYAKVKAQAKQLLADNLIVSTNWNCLTNDAAGSNTAEEIMNSLLTSIGDQKSLIVLMHDASDKQLTADTLPQIIEYFKNEGYKFKTFYDVFK